LGLGQQEGVAGAQGACGGAIAGDTKTSSEFMVSTNGRHRKVKELKGISPRAKTKTKRTWRLTSGSRWRTRCVPACSAKIREGQGIKESERSSVAAL